jgi:hypothetical protein
MSAFRHAATLSTVGVIVLLVGIGGAVLVYRLGQNPSAASTTNSDWKDSTLSLTDSKTSTRDIELYGGKLGVLMVRWLEWLQRPESLAIIIATISALIALGCFLLARRLPFDT